MLSANLMKIANNCKNFKTDYSDTLSVIFARSTSGGAILVLVITSVENNDEKDPSWPPPPPPPPGNTSTKHAISSC